MPRPHRYRPTIPVTLKLKILLRQDGYCHETPEKRCGCGRLFTDETAHEINFDHVPALGLRPWSEDEEDTEPAANDPRHICAKFKRECHDPKTFGTRSRRRGSDLYEIRRNKEIDRIAAERERKTQSDVPPPGQTGQAAAATAAAIDRPYARWPDAVIGRRVEDDEGDGQSHAGRYQNGDHRKPAKKHHGRMRGQGFRTNRDSPYKKTMRGEVVRRVKRQPAVENTE